MIIRAITDSIWVSFSVYQEIKEKSTLHTVNYQSLHTYQYKTNSIVTFEYGLFSI